MCNPGAMFAVQVGMSVMGAQAARKAAKGEQARTQRVAEQAEENGRDALALQYQQLALQGMQQDDAATENIVQSAIEAAKLESTAYVSAGENGVGGISVGNLLGDYQRQLAQNTNIANVNSAARAAQRTMEKKGMRSNYFNRVTNARNGISSGADPYASALSIGSSTLDAGTRYLGWGTASPTATRSPTPNPHIA